MKKNFLLLITLCFLHLSCDKNNYGISKNTLYCRYGLNHGFELNVLDVKNFNPDGTPDEYTVTQKAYYLSKYINLGDKKSYRKFYFDKANGESGYEWEWRLGGTKKYSKICPIKFDKNVWYKLDLSNVRCRRDDLYFKFDNEWNVMKKHIYMWNTCDGAW